MQGSQIDLQVVVTVALILGAAVVALACDFLRHNYQQLQDQLDSLHGVNLVPADESSMLGRILVPQQELPLARSATPSPATAAPPAASRSTRKTVRPTDARRAPSIGASETMERANTIAAQTLKRPATSETTTSERAVPAGLHHTQVLHRMIHAHRPVSGLVVSIGVQTAPRNDNGTSLAVSIAGVIQGLLSDGEFAAAYSDDEFILVLPIEQGASAQRRLGLLSRQLWDCQIRSLGKEPAVFNLGSVEVNHQTLDKAVAMASEKMRESRQGRKVPEIETPRALQRAV